MSALPREWGSKTSDDGSSRPFGGGTLRDLIAETLARRDGWAEIRPAHWWTAGAVVKNMKAAGYPTRLPKAGDS